MTGGAGGRLVPSQVRLGVDRTVLLGRDLEPPPDVRGGHLGGDRESRRRAQPAGIRSGEHGRRVLAGRRGRLENHHDLPGRADGDVSEVRGRLAARHIDWGRKRADRSPDHRSPNGVIVALRIEAEPQTRLAGRPAGADVDSRLIDSHSGRAGQLRDQPQRLPAIGTLDDSDPVARGDVCHEQVTGAVETDGRVADEPRQTVPTGLGRAELAGDERQTTILTDADDSAGVGLVVVGCLEHLRRVHPVDCDGRLGLSANDVAGVDCYSWDERSGRGAVFEDHETREGRPTDWTWHR